MCICYLPTVSTSLPVLKMPYQYSFHHMWFVPTFHSSQHSTRRCKIVASFWAWIWAYFGQVVIFIWCQNVTLMSCCGWVNNFKGFSKRPKCLSWKLLPQKIREIFNVFHFSRDVLIFVSCHCAIISKFWVSRKIWARQKIRVFLYLFNFGALRPKVW